MKKTLAILLAVVLVAVMMPTAIFAGAATDAEKAIWDQLFLKSDGVEIDYDACTLTAGSAVTFKATIPAGGFIQFNQKLSDLVPASDAGDMDVQVIPSNITTTYFNVQLTADATGTDIVPVDEVGGADPGNVAASTLFISNKTTYMFMGRGAYNGGDVVQTVPLSNTGFWGNGVRMRFYGDGNGHIITRLHGYGTITKTSKQTVAELGGQNGLYVRVRSMEAETYTITINSADISAAYRDGNYILSDRESTVDAESVTYSYNAATGKSTYTAKVTLSGNGSYVQFGKKLADLFSGASMKITVGKNGRDEYKNAPMQLQLLGDAGIMNDVVPARETYNNTVDPGTKAITWDVTYHSSQPNNYMLGKGCMGIGAKMGGSAGNFDTIAGAGGLYVDFGNTGAGKVFIKTICDKTYGEAAENYISYHTATETGMTDGGYFRIRNNADGERTYTIAVTTKAVRYTDGAYKFSDEGSKLISTARVVEDGRVKETATVKLYPGAYVQLDRKLVDFIPASDAGSMMVQVLPETVQATDFHVQITADATALTDIVPVNEVGGANPGNLGTSTQFYCNGSNVYIARGKLNNSDATNTIVAMGNTSFWANGIRMRFYGDGNGHITTRFHGYGTAAKTSVQTIADLGGQNGLYFRLRNNKSTEHTYTVTVYYKNTFVAETANGTVTLDKTAALTGETVTATVNAADNYQLKAGSLKYVMNGKEYPITTRVGDESVSNVFTFAMPEDAVTVKAEFVKADAVNVALLGAGLNVADGKLGQDMRFGTRAYRKAGDKTLFLCGNYVLHAQSDLGKAITANGGVISEDLAEQLVSPAEGQIVKRVPTGVLNDRCTEYVDFTLRITGVGADAYKNTEYMCIAYTIYKDNETGELTTYYADACTRSYQGVVDALN